MTINQEEYYKLVLRKTRDRELLEWLESDRQPGEGSQSAVRRKLYRLFKEQKQRGKK